MAEFPTIPVLASFGGEATEKPLSEGGKWEQLSWCVSAGEIHGLSDGYTSATALAELNGASWTPNLFTFPAVSWEPLFPENGAGEWFALWCCLDVAKHNGYRQRVESLGTEANFKVVLERIKEGTAFTLSETASMKLTAKDKMGLTYTSAGKVISWHKIGAGAWAVLNETADANFVTGRIGIETKSTSTKFGQINFSGGNTPGIPVRYPLRLFRPQAVRRSAVI